MAHSFFYYVLHIFEAKIIRNIINMKYTKKENSILNFPFYNIFKSYLIIYSSCLSGVVYIDL